MRISTGLAVAAALAASLFAPVGAAAATEFGDHCTANESTPGPVVTIFEITTPGGLSNAAPTSGVITSWKMSLISVPFSYPQTLKVLRVNGAGTVLTVGEASGAFGTGVTSAPARIPIQAGDLLGIHGNEVFKTVFCKVAATEVSTIGFFPGSGAGAGGTTPYVSGASPGLRVPVTAVVEPDADHDGYGDETQDKCPQSAAYQDPCPVLVLDTYVLPNRSKAVVVVSSSLAASVTVSGSAKLPKASSSAQAKLKGVTKSVTAGRLNRFTLNFPGPLKSAIKTLPKGKSITVKLQASATDVTGKKITDKAKLKLKG